MKGHISIRRSVIRFWYFFYLVFEYNKLLMSNFQEHSGNKIKFNKKEIKLTNSNDNSFQSL